MNRPCTALSILLASLAGTMLAVGSAKCQTGPKAGPDSFGRCHICPLAEEFDFDCLYGACENGDNNGDLGEKVGNDRYLDEYDYSYECGEAPNYEYANDYDDYYDYGYDYTDEVEPKQNSTDTTEMPNNSTGSSNDDYTSDYDYSDYDYSDDYGYGSYNDDYESYDYQYDYEYGNNDSRPTETVVESTGDSSDVVTDETPSFSEQSDYDYGLDGDYDYRSGYDSDYDTEVYGNQVDESDDLSDDPFRDLFRGLNECEEGFANDASDDYWTNASAVDYTHNAVSDDYWIHAIQHDDYWTHANSVDYGIRVSANDDYWQHANTIDFTVQTIDSDDYWTNAELGHVTTVDSSSDQIWDDCERWYDEEDYYYDHYYEWQDHRQPSTVEAPPAPVADEQPVLGLDWSRPMILLMARTLNRVGVAIQDASHDLVEMAGADVAGISRPVSGATQR
jgi:hypothetical protein